jgi:hypothetical protein
VVGCFHVVAIALAYSLTGISFDAPTAIQFILPAILSFLLIFVGYTIYTDFPENPDELKNSQYRVILVPFTPLLAIFINYTLFAQLSWSGIALTFCYYGLATLLYFSFGVRGDNAEWKKVLAMGSLKATTGMEMEGDKAEKPILREPTSSTMCSGESPDNYDANCNNHSNDSHIFSNENGFGYTPSKSNVEKNVEMTGNLAQAGSTGRIDANISRERDQCVPASYSLIKGSANQHNYHSVSLTEE